jgi:hypothetical protein
MLPKLGVGCTGEARREATLDDRIGLAARVAAGLLPEAGAQATVEAGYGR